MLRDILVVAFCCVANSVVAAPLKDVCPTLATGKWVIVSTREDSPITALTTEEARAYIGTKISVSEHKVVYGDQKCEVVRERVDYSTDALTGTPGYPYSVIYYCQDKKMFIPGFEIGKSCDRIRSDRDGWAFVLRRSK